MAASGEAALSEPKVIRIVGRAAQSQEHHRGDPTDRLTVITGLSGRARVPSPSTRSTRRAAQVRGVAVGLRSSVPGADAEARRRPDRGLGPDDRHRAAVGQHEPRSTVATVTEIYDFLRVLYARVGQPCCWVCRAPISRQSSSQIVDAVLALPRRRITVLAPLVSGRRGTHAELMAG